MIEINQNQTKPWLLCGRTQVIPYKLQVYFFQNRVLNGLIVTLTDSYILKDVLIFISMWHRDWKDLR